jgi:hypothetical protein
MRIETRYAELVFLHLVGSVHLVLNSSASGPQNNDALFFMLGCDWYRFHKVRVGTHYAKLVFLHPVAYAGHVTPNLCFCIQWDMRVT